MNPNLPNSFRSGPDETGHFGIFGGRFVAETLMPLILDLEKAYAKAKADPAFHKEMDGYLKDYVGRPSPLYYAERLTDARVPCQVEVVPGAFHLFDVVAPKARVSQSFFASQCANG